VQWLQPWQFVVIDEREGLNGLAAAHPYAQMCRQAALAIVVCGDVSNAKSPDYWPQDCAAATQNILVAARALGLGTCWCGVFPSQKRIDAVRALLGIPETVIPFCIIAAGYPDEQKPPGNRYDAARVHHNRW
jgi:nitroreductase